MSVDYSIHVGAYLEIREALTLTTVDRCADHDRGAAAFCPTCGRDEGRRYMTIGAAPSDDYWGAEKWVDSMVRTLVSEEDYDGTSTRITLAISNRVRGDGLRISPRWDEPAAHEIPWPADCRRALLDEHRPDIDRLRELGCAVEVKFGVLSWSS